MAPLATGAVVAGVTLNPADAGAGDLYLRAKMGLGRSSETVFGDRDCLITSPVEFYGCGQGRRRCSLRSFGGFETAPALEFGLSYSTARALGLELLAEYRTRASPSKAARNSSSPGGGNWWKLSCCCRRPCWRPRSTCRRWGYRGSSGLRPFSGPVSTPSATGSATVSRPFREQSPRDFRAKATAGALT